jgi:serralysin
VLALRHLYGSRTLDSGDTVHRLAGAQGIAETVIIDDGGSDTIDASALSVGARLDLRSGALSSVGVTTQGFYGVDNLGLVATSVIENAIGTPADDVLLGNSLDNRLTGGAGNDWIEGGEGLDSALFEGSRSAYEVSTGFGKVFVRAGVRMRSPATSAQPEAATATWPMSLSCRSMTLHHWPAP